MNGRPGSRENWKYNIIPPMSEKGKMEMRIIMKPNTNRGAIPCIPARYIFTLMGFLGFVTLYTLRVNLNVAIVAMVNETAVYNQSLGHECPLQEKNTTSRANSENGEFDWTPKMQGFVLGSFFYGYCITQIPGGRLSEMFGAKWVFGFGTLLASLMTLLTPIAASWHVSVLITLRIIEGLAQGVTMPAMHSMLGRWLPESEKGLLSTIIYNGINIGTVVGMTVSGVLCNSYLFEGWPSAFYVFGFFGCIWFVFWVFLVYDTPASHPRILPSELKYIRENQTIQHAENFSSIPCLAIMTSVPFWALIITQLGQDWCFYTILTDLPTFLGTVLHFEIEKNGILSSLPYLFQTVVGLFVGYITDFCLKKQFVTVNFVRKFCNSVAGFGTVLGLIGVCLAGCNVTLTIAFFTAASAIGSFCYCGYMLSHLDLSPEYAGTLMGISNTISNLTGFITPTVVGALTEHHQTLQQWRIVFYITIAILTVTSIVFILFGSTERQPWAPSGVPHAILQEDASSVECINSTNNDYGSVSLGNDKRS